MNIPLPDDSDDDELDLGPLPSPMVIPGFYPQVLLEVPEPMPEEEKEIEPEEKESEPRDSDRSRA